MKKLPVQRFRGDTPGGPCAILGCPETATTGVTWAAYRRHPEITIWYCEPDAQAAIERWRQAGRQPASVERVEAES